MIDRLLELAALDAAGALPPAEQRELGRLLADATDAATREVAALYDSAAAIPAGTRLETPAASVRARILAHAARRP